MVLAFIIQTLDPEEPVLAYYRFYPGIIGVSEQSEGTQTIFESSTDKNKFLTSIIKKVHMHYSLKLKQSLIPVQNQDSRTLIKGHYIERQLKSCELTICWEGVPGIGFCLVIDKEENVLLAKNILDLIVSQLEKHLQLVSFPAGITKNIDSVALIVENYLPGGNLIFLNSSLIKILEKQLETCL